MIAPAIFGGIALLIGAFLLIRHPSYLGAFLFASLLTSVGATGITALGNPVPLSVATYRFADEVTVLSYKMDEKHGQIYLLIEGAPPQLVQMPWNEKQAAQLYGADQAAKAAHTALKMRLSGNGTGNGKPGAGDKKGGKQSGASGTKDAEGPMFWAAPPQPLPDKQAGS